MYTMLAGHEQESSVDHASRAVRAAVDIIEAAEKVKGPKGKHVEIRIGVHTGPVVAGMIGCKGPRYCVMGGALRVSSMLEATSHTSCVQVSDATYAQVRNTSVSREVHFIELAKEIDTGAEGPVGVYLLDAGNWQAAHDAQQEMSGSCVVQDGQPADAAGVEGIQTPNDVPVRERDMRFDEPAGQSPRAKGPRSSRGLLGCFSAPHTTQY